MSRNKEYFHIELSHLKDKKIFAFQLYVYNKANEQYTLYLHANSPLTKPKKQLIEFILDKGGSLAVSRKQKKTFLVCQEINESDIPDLKVQEEHPLEKNQKMYKVLLEQKRERNGEFLFQNEMQKALDDNEFSDIIDEVRDQVMTFDVTTSHTTSLAIFLCEHLLTNDNYINRIVAVSYFFAKTLDVTDEESLGDLICAAFFAHLGFTQMESSIMHSPVIALSEQMQKTYKKHPGLSQHLLRKSGVELSDRCIKTVLEHHERFDGSGYPFNKMGDYIEPLSLILGVVAHLFEHTIGHITSEKRTFAALIANIREKNFNTGLEFEFGDKIIDNISFLIKEENTNVV